MPDACPLIELDPVAELQLQARADAQPETAVDAEVPVVNNLCTSLRSSMPLSTRWMPPSLIGLMWAATSTGSIRESVIAHWRW